MSGLRKCKEFLLNLTPEDLKTVKVVIKRANIPEPKEHMAIHRRLDDPNSLVIHFKKESLRGIFDREEIILNQEFDDELLKTNSRNYDSSSSVEETRTVFHHRETSNNEKNKRGKSYRSRSGSHRRDRSPARESYNKLLNSVDRSRSRSFSPPTHQKKKPGLFIPTESDYLKIEKRKAQRSHSPIPSCSTMKDREQSRKRSSVDRYRPLHKRNRSRSTSRRSRSGSPKYRRWHRSRSRDEHFEGRMEVVGPESPPFLFRDGQYWIPVGPTLMPRGFMPIPPMYPRPYMPHMLMPRMPNMPFRQRLPQLRHNSSVIDVTSEISVPKTEACDDTGKTNQNKQSNQMKAIDHL